MLVALRAGVPLTRSFPRKMLWQRGLPLGLSWAFSAMAVAGPWSHVDGDTVLDAAAAPQAAEARVVWLGGNPIQDTATRVLLDFYRVSTPLDRTV